MMLRSLALHGLINRGVDPYGDRILAKHLASNRVSLGKGVMAPPPTTAEKGPWQLQAITVVKGTDFGLTETVSRAQMYAEALALGAKLLQADDPFRLLTKQFPTGLTGTTICATEPFDHNGLPSLFALQRDESILLGTVTANDNVGWPVDVSWVFELPDCR